MPSMRIPFDQSRVLVSMLVESKVEVWPELPIPAQGPRRVRLKLLTLLSLYLFPLFGIAAIGEGIAASAASIDNARELSQHGIVTIATLESQRVETNPKRTVYTYSFVYERSTLRFDDVRGFPVLNPRAPVQPTKSKKPLRVAVTIVPDKPEQHRFGVYGKADVAALELEEWGGVAVGAVILIIGTIVSARTARKERAILRNYTACPAKISRIGSLLYSGKKASTNATFRYLKPDGRVGELGALIRVPSYENVIGNADVVLEDLSLYGTACLLSKLKCVEIDKD